MAASDAPETVKVFVGNLSFKITQAQLKEAFQSAGSVVSANIITRGPRSLGYGFVEFGNQADAEQAVSSLHQTELDSRPINVEIAKPRVPRAEAPASTGESAPKPAGGRPRGTRNYRPRTRSGTGPRRPRTSSSSGATSSGASAPAGATSSGASSSSSASSSSGASSSGPRPRGPRGPRRGPRRGPAGAPAPRTSAPRDASKTTLFVANLPFSVNDEGLRKIFTDKGFVPKVARVVLRRDRSKGFGFVEFETEQQQIAARDALDNFTVDARPLSVKIAFAVPETPEPSPAPTN